VRRAARGCFFQSNGNPAGESVPAVAVLRRQIFQMQAQQFSAVQYPKRAPRLLQSALQAEESGHKGLGAQVAAYTEEVLVLRASEAVRVAASARRMAVRRIEPPS
jgi:hypothetical protein